MASIEIPDDSNKIRIEKITTFIATQLDKYHKILTINDAIAVKKISDIVKYDQNFQKFITHLKDPEYAKLITPLYQPAIFRMVGGLLYLFDDESFDEINRIIEDHKLSNMASYDMFKTMLIYIAIKKDDPASYITFIKEASDDILTLYKYECTIFDILVKSYESVNGKYRAEIYKLLDEIQKKLPSLVTKVSYIHAMAIRDYPEGHPMVIVNRSILIDETKLIEGYSTCYVCSENAHDTNLIYGICACKTMHVHLRCLFNTMNSRNDNNYLNCSICKTKYKINSPIYINGKYVEQIFFPTRGCFLQLGKDDLKYNTVNKLELLIENCVIYLQYDALTETIE